MLNGTKTHIVKKKRTDYSDFVDKKIWKDINQLEIDNYLWMNNNYKPKVEVKLFYTDKFIYLKFVVHEKRIRVEHTKFGEDVYKDSCVEFFFNPFPDSQNEYINIEINSVGIALIGAGVNATRKRLTQKEADGFEIIPSVPKNIIGFHNVDGWELHYRINIEFFENYFQKNFKGGNTKANFYKCGNETEFEHYGAWNSIDNPTPNFHLPQYFGKLIFLD